MAEFDAEGLEPFVYDSGKPGAKPISMSYRRAPDAAFDDEELMGEWFDSALGAAIRSGADPQKRTRKITSKRAQ